MCITNLFHLKFCFWMRKYNSLFFVTALLMSLLFWCSQPVLHCLNCSQCYFPNVWIVQPRADCFHTEPWGWAPSVYGGMQCTELEIMFVCILLTYVQQRFHNTFHWSNIHIRFSKFLEQAFHIKTIHNGWEDSTLAYTHFLSVRPVNVSDLQWGAIITKNYTKRRTSRRVSWGSNFHYKIQGCFP